MVILFHRLAAREYRESRNWYRKRSADAAERFRQAIIDVTNQIETMPESFPFDSNVKGYRIARVRRFRFVMYYRTRAPNVVVIVALSHTSRRVGYWRHRKI